MADISQLIEPKSDQLNADDLMAGDRTIRITEVKVLGAGREQPIWIHFDGGNGKPWKPCKTMARMLANLWRSPETSTWVGKSVTLYRDPDVLWAGAKIGGIRVRAVSHIEAPIQVAITESKSKRKLAMIGVITAEVTPMTKAKQTAEEWADEQAGAAKVCASLDSLAELIGKGAPAMRKLEASKPELWAKVNAAYAAKRAELEGDDSGFADAPAEEAFGADAD